MAGTVTRQARRQAAELLAEHGQTYAAQAGIRLRDKPARCTS